MSSDSQHDRFVSLAGSLAAVTVAALLLFVGLSYAAELLPWPLPRWLVFLIALGITTSA